MKHIKSKIAMALTTVMCISIAFASTASADNEQTAAVSQHVVFVDGEQAAVAAYNIDGSNYFKLRDIAAVLSGSDKQFNVSWDSEAEQISLQVDTPYAPVGGELAVLEPGNKTAVPSFSPVLKGGEPMAYEGYFIDGNNYYKLRDVAQSFDIGIEWDEENGRINILTSKGYEDETQPEAPAEPGVYTPEWQAVLDEAQGEEIVSVTLRYQIKTSNNEPIPKDLAMYLWFGDYHDSAKNSPDYFEPYIIMSDVADGTGAGSITVEIPRSVYAKACYGGHWFFFKGESFTLDGVEFQSDYGATGFSIGPDYVDTTTFEILYY